MGENNVKETTRLEEKNKEYNNLKEKLDDLKREKEELAKEDINEIDLSR